MEGINTVEKGLIGRQKVIPFLPGNGNGKLNGGFSDSAFTDNKRRPIHRWVPWIAGFSAEFVQDVLNTYIGAKDPKTTLVLDPFCGVGTTIVESMRLGFNSVGFEINPYAALAATTKCEAPYFSLPKLNRHILEFEEYMQSDEEIYYASPPKYFRTRIPFFGALTEAKILKALSFIGDIENRGIHNLFAVALGSVMVSLSNYSYEPSLSSRPAAGKPLQKDAPVADAIISRLNFMREDIEWIKREVSQLSQKPVGRVINDNFLSALRHLDLGSVDLIVTSPPYLNNYHYIRNTRPQLFWLGLITSPEELKPLENDNFGKYWQTVRNAKKISLDFANRNLEDLLSKVRCISRERGTYGGAGWANYAASYFNDTNRFCGLIKKLLKRNGRAVIVLGNSILQGVEIPVDDLLSDLAAKHDLETENIHIIREKRVGASILMSSIRKGAKTRAKLYESAVILRKR